MGGTDSSRGNLQQMVQKSVNPYPANVEKMVSS